MGSIRLRWRSVASLALCLALLSPYPASAADLSEGEPGSGPGAPVVRELAPRQLGFADVGSTYSWAAPAIRYVAQDRHWMDDFGADEFHPAAIERRKLFARAVVRAFAPGEAVDPDIEFSDIPRGNDYWEYANVAVKMGWMRRTKDGKFLPDDPVTGSMAHETLVRALGLREEVAGLDDIHTADGYRFAHNAKFPYILIGMKLHFRYNHSKEADDVSPRDPLPRAEVAYSLWRAAITTQWDIAGLAKFRDIQLPAMANWKHKWVEFGMRWIGYPYVWGGDWYEKTASGYCCGAQPVGGFDCSGLMWWTLKRPDGGYNNRDVRSYEGWALPQRASSDMASIGKHLSYDAARPGDLMFYDGDSNGGIDHVDVFLGNGWAFDSSSGVGGVTILRVGEGWYRDHFVHARSIMN
jgi:hypothetical protein